MSNQAHIEFHDIGSWGFPGIESWEPGTYNEVPVIGDLVWIRFEDGGEELWRVEDRCVYPSRVELYCRFHQQMKKPNV